MRLCAALFLLIICSAGPCLAFLPASRTLPHPLPTLPTAHRPAQRLRGGVGAARMDADVQFVTNKMCPFAQKAWIALEEKRVDYELTEVGLYGSGGKPSWFIKMNPKGLVPVLRHGSKVVVESNDICRYIDAQFGTPNSLCPQGEGSGSVEWWMQLMDSKILPFGKQAVNSRGSSNEQFHAALKEFDGAVKGPYLLGDTFSLADIVAAPMIWRIRTEAHSLRVTPKEYPKLCAWIDTVCARRSFSKTVSSSWWWWW